MAVPGSAAVVTAKPLAAQMAPVSDRSLDEFVTGSDGAVDETDGSDADDDAPADPSVPTMRWAPDGAACDACGTTVQRRWHDGDDFVCADCKEW